ncbi:MAG TPA: hypothetical protein VKB38_24975 [Terracidiphilus sp.]|nr:hypothetical protein [Terracidiphilus sp.]
MRTVAGAARSVIVLGAIAAAGMCASAQAYRVRPMMIRPGPMAVNSGTLTLSATPGTVKFTLVPGGTVQASGGVSVTTTWNFKGNNVTLNVYGYFSSAAAALTDGFAPPDLIPSSAVFGQVSTGVPTAYTAFTQATPYNGAASGLLLVNETFAKKSNSSRTDVLNLEINLSNQPKLPAGTYTGTLTIQATMN